MCQSSPSRQSKSRGFSLIEVMVAIAVLTIGLISVAALATTMLATGKRSKYMALASTLASEKLEDLSRYSNDQPEVCLPTGSATVGSLTADVLQTTTCPTGALQSIAYDDDVSISFGNTTGDCPNQGGCFAETTTSASAGNTQYQTTYHSPDGRITTTAPTTTKSSQMMTFHRRWLIEGDTPVTGTRRVTVIVNLTGNIVNPPVSFQMSTVRP